MAELEEWRMRERLLERLLPIIRGIEPGNVDRYRGLLERMSGVELRVLYEQFKWEEKHEQEDDSKEGGS